MAPSETKALIPKPLIVETSKDWLGRDGPWSSFVINVGPANLGSPRYSQEVRLLPSTSLGQVYVINGTGCNGQLRFIVTGNNRSCEESRGGLFSMEKDPLTRLPNSTVYRNPGQFSIVGNYGSPTLLASMWTDTVSFGFSSSVSVSSIPIGSITDADYTWTGLLGIDSRPTNFSLPVDNSDGNGMNYLEQIPSMLQQLKSSRNIPSTSWSYHAGSFNQENGGEEGHGSLILGGWDTNRMKDGSRIEYNFNGDWEKALTVRTLNVSLGFQSTNLPAETLLQKTPPAYETRVDSSLPYLYLPEEVCDSIASKLSLIWNEPSQHYLINSSQHDELLTRAPFLEFDLAPMNFSASYRDPNSKPSSQKFRLSYKHLALTLQSNRSASRYFPMKKAISPLHNLLGRAFLQETYLIANYERFSFTLGEIDWTKVSLFNRELQAIPEVYTALPSYLYTGTANKKSLSNVQIIGIAVGVGAFLSLLMALIFFCRKRKFRIKVHMNGSKKDNTEEEEGTKTGTELDSSAASPDSPLAKMVELDNSEITISELESKTITEMPDTGGILAGYYKEVELDSSPKKEIFEMEGSPVSPDKKQSPPPASRNRNASTSPSISSGEDSLLGPLPNRLRVVRAPPGVPASPIPQTPQEYYGRHARRRFGFSSADISQSQQQQLDAVLASKGTQQDNRPPASAIPQTPLEYYGGQVPAHRQQQAQAPRTEVTPPVEESTLTKEGQVEDEQRNHASGLQVPADARGRGRDEMHRSGVQSPASPIPQTPLEMYGRVPASVGPAEQRRWIGRAPDVPSVNLVPPTPASPSAPPVPLRSAAREMRLSEKSPERPKRKLDSGQNERRES